MEINTSITISGNTHIYDDNGNDSGKTLPTGSSWHADEMKTMNDSQVFYRVATNEWVHAYSVSNGSTTVNLKSSQSVYNTSTNSMTRSLPAGSTWKMTNVVRNKNNQFWGQVSTNEWLLIDSNNVNMSYGDSDSIASIAVSEPEFALGLK